MSEVEQLSLWKDEYEVIADELQHQTEHQAQLVQARLDATPVIGGPLWAPEPITWTPSSQAKAQTFVREVTDNLSKAGREVLNMGDEPISDEVAHIVAGVRADVVNGLIATDNVIRNLYDQMPDSTSARRAVASVGLAGAVLIGATGIDNTVQQENPNLIVQRTTKNTILDLGDISDQDLLDSQVAAANASGIAPEDQEVREGRMYLPATVTDDQLRAIYLAFTAPDDVPTTTTSPETTQQLEGPAEAEVKEETPAEIEALNVALAKIDINAPTIDLTEVVLAAQAVDRLLAPTDKDRLPNMPAGYVKVWLPSEADGLNVPFTPAQRLADVERYTSSQSAAVQYAVAKMYQQLIAEKYPHLAGDMLRLRDSNSPHHETHNDGRQIDMNGALGWDVSHYSDGAMGDYLFSNRYDPNFTRDMAILSAKLSLNGERVVSSILYSDQRVVNEANGALGFEYMSNQDSYHKDHFHLTLRQWFALERWRPAVGELPWDGIQDLKIAGEARDISKEQHDSQHKDHEWWAYKWMLEQQPSTVQPAPEAPVAQPEPTAPLPAESVEYIKSVEAKIEELRPVYEEIEARTGVKWYYMAAIHFREGGNRADASMFAGEQLGSVNPDNGQVQGTTLLENGIKAAEHFKAMAKGVYGIDVTTEMGLDELGKALLAYNRGSMYKHADEHINREMTFHESPYVMNGLPGHEDMHFPDNGRLQGSNSWGEPERVQGRLDERPGALAVIAHIQASEPQPTVPDTVVNPEISPTTQPQASQPEVPPAEPEENAQSSENQPTVPEVEVPEVTTTTQTPVQPVTTTESVDEEIETIEIDPLSWFDEEKTKHIYEPYFKDNQDGLEEWVSNLPQEEVDGEVRYQVDVNRIPKEEE